MRQMTDLITWLRAQLDEDERVAQAALKRVARWPKAQLPPWEVAAIAAARVSAFTLEQLQQFADPARVLAEVKARRAIIAGYEASYRESDDYPGWEGAVYAIAQPYADRPGWRDEWSVTS